MTHTDKELRELRDYYDNNSQVDGIDDGVFVPSGDSDPLIPTSVRLPSSMVERLDEIARERHVKRTSLIRSLLEEILNAGGTLASRLSALEQEVSKMKRTGQ